MMRIFFEEMKKKNLKQVCWFVSYFVCYVKSNMIDKDFAHSIIDSLFDFIDGDVRNKKTCLFRQADPVWLR